MRKFLQMIRGVRLIVTRPLALCFLGALLTAVGAIAEENNTRCIEAQVNALAGQNFEYAATQLWVPTGLREVKGILCIVIHPLDNGGAMLGNPGPWSELAAHYDCAVMAVSFAQATDTTKSWCKPELGTGAALLQAIDLLSKKSGIANLNKVPIVMAGVCAAGQFSYNFAALYPNRVASFVTIGGGKHNLDYAWQASAIPGLLVVCTERTPEDAANLKNLFSMGKKYSAPWMLGFEKMSEYDAGRCSVEVADFLSASLASLSSGGSIKKALAAILVRQAPSYLPLPFPGKKLPALGDMAPGSIDVGNVDVDDPKTASTRFHFEVHRDSGCAADSIAIDCPAIDSSIQSTEVGSWLVDGTINLSDLPLGPFSVEIPIRFEHGGQPLLGQTRGTVIGNLVGDVSVVPRSLVVGSIPSSKVSGMIVHLVSKDGKPLTLLGHVSASHDWVKVTSRNINPTTIELKCDFNPPKNLANSLGFSGYLQGACETNHKYRLKIYYDGFVASDE